MLLRRSFVCRASVHQSLPVGKAVLMPKRAQRTRAERRAQKQRRREMKMNRQREALKTKKWVIRGRDSLKTSLRISLVPTRQTKMMIRWEHVLVSCQPPGPNNLVLLLFGACSQQLLSATQSAIASLCRHSTTLVKIRGELWNLQHRNQEIKIGRSCQHIQAVLSALQQMASVWNG